MAFSTWMNTCDNFNIEILRCFPCAFCPDLETTSAVFSSVICGTVVARKPSIMPASSAAATAAAPQPTTIVNCTAETPKRYHGGWCVVAVRRELEASRKPELTSVKPVLATFGYEILANMSPNLPNFEKIIESETHEHPPCVCSCVCMHSVGMHSVGMSVCVCVYVCMCVCAAKDGSLVVPIEYGP